MAQALWSVGGDDAQLYALIDGSRCVSLYTRLLESSLDWCSLYQGAAAALHLHDAPYLIALKKGDDLMRWLIEEGHGQGWGIYCTASDRTSRDAARDANFQRFADLREQGHFNASAGIELTADPSPLLALRRHFRHFTEVQRDDEGGRSRMFRFYDPAVLCLWLMHCRPEDLAAAFGPVQAFLIHAEAGIRRLSLISDEAGGHRLDLAEVGVPA